MQPREKKQTDKQRLENQANHLSKWNDNQGYHQDVEQMAQNTIAISKAHIAIAISQLVNLLYLTWFTAVLALIFRFFYSL